MLKHLSIQNYALIDQLALDLEMGLSIITGETGAGKSIILGALALLTGQRADLKALKSSDNKCVVEGTFQINNYNLHDFFEKENLDYDEQTIIRREILPNGKSRAFINDTPASLSQLKELGFYLIDIHSQHQNLELHSSDFQLSVIDVIANHYDLLNRYKTEYKLYRKIQTELSELIEKEKQLKKDFDYFQFQFKELEEAALKAEEQSLLEQELNTMSHAEEIKQKLTQLCSVFENGDNNLISEISSAAKQLKSLGAYHNGINEIHNRLDSVIIELNDISSELCAIEEKVFYNPHQIELINQRLDLIYDLQHKHQVKTINDLLIIKNDLESKLNHAFTLETQIEELQNKLLDLENELSDLAHELSQNRKQAIPAIEKKLKELLNVLGMPNSEFKIKQNYTDDKKLSSNGFDKISFLFSANKGMPYREIQEVASGGEISRLILSIKSILAVSKTMPTIIFDEIDSGVSGEIADKMGKLIRDMAKKIQVICITHLPQIASKAHAHYFAYKKSDKKTTASSIKQLNDQERLTEIARMLSGENLSTAALENAKDLLMNN
jgi:DNA repair protein RecN (Recombination protein N)